MDTPELLPIEPDDVFRFACHSKVSCFNHCCRDLNQALTPYDVLCLKNHLNMSTRQFIASYALMHIGAVTGLPVVSLRFGDAPEKSCPFVTPEGCRVYDARPASCRIYPLARALRRNRADGSISEHFAVLRESHCQGFHDQRSQTVRQWLEDQQLDMGLKMNDLMMELIALKNQLRPGPLSPEHLRLVQMAFYDLESVTDLACQGKLPDMCHDHLDPLPDPNDDAHWLRWSLMWIGQVLFAKRLSI